MLVRLIFNDTQLIHSDLSSKITLCLSICLHSFDSFEINVFLGVQIRIQLCQEHNEMIRIILFSDISNYIFKNLIKKINNK